MQQQAGKQKQQQAAAPTPPGAMMSADAAYEEIRQVFGSVPDFLAKFPREGIAGAWREMRDVEMNPSSALNQKEKSLIGVAVASQVPCRFCLAADTEFAKMAGATERELSEAVAMAAITRHWSTMLHGQQTDENAFRRDIDRIVRNVKKQQPQQAGVARAQPQPMPRRDDKATQMPKGDSPPMRVAPASSAKTQGQMPPAQLPAQAAGQKP
jgi:AhpD family alkylhydroperoxidase